MNTMDTIRTILDLFHVDKDKLILKENNSKLINISNLVVDDSIPFSKFFLPGRSDTITLTDSIFVGKELILTPLSTVVSRCKFIDCDITFSSIVVLSNSDVVGNSNISFYNSFSTTVRNVLVDTSSQTVYMRNINEVQFVNCDIRNKLILHDVSRVMFIDTEVTDVVYMYSGNGPEDTEVYHIPTTYELRCE